MDRGRHVVAIIVLNETSELIQLFQPFFAAIARKIVATSKIDTIELSGMRMAASSGLICPLMAKPTVVRL